jgi:hypothetical protein
MLGDQATSYKVEQGPIFLDQVICSLPAPTALAIRQLHILAAHYTLNRLEPFHNITFHKAVSG